MKRNKQKLSVKGSNKNQCRRTEHMPKKVNLNRENGYLKIAMSGMKIVRKYMQ